MRAQVSLEVKKKVEGEVCESRTVWRSRWESSEDEPRQSTK